MFLSSPFRLPRSAPEGVMVPGEVYWKCEALRQRARTGILKERVYCVLMAKRRNARRVY